MGGRKSPRKVLSDINKNVDELLTQTRGIQGKVKLAEQKKYANRRSAEKTRMFI